MEKKAGSLYAAVKFNNKKIKRPSHIPPFPDIFHMPLALLVLTWGAFEMRINDMLGLYLIASPDPKPLKGWVHRSFKQRTTMLQAAAQRIYQDLPDGLEFFSATLKRATEIHTSRNAIVHGKLVYKAIANSQLQQEDYLLATIRHKDGDIEHTFTADSIETMAYDVMHLSGCYAALFPDSVLPYDEVPYIARSRHLLNMASQTQANH